MQQPKTIRGLPGVPHVTAMSWDQAKKPLEDFLKRLQALHDSLPAPHATTHMGPQGAPDRAPGSDSVSGTGLPSPITPGIAGDLGDPTQGFAPIGHVHDATALDIINDLNDLVDPGTGLAVTDIKVRRELEDILLAIDELLAQIMELVDMSKDTDPLANSITPPLFLPTTDVQILSPELLERYGIIIVNDSTATLYVKYGPDASVNSWTYKIGPGGTLESMNLSVRYVGPISGVWDGVGGRGAQVTILVGRN